MAPSKTAAKRKLEKVAPETKTNGLTTQNGDEDHEEVSNFILADWLSPR